MNVKEFISSWGLVIFLVFFMIGLVIYLGYNLPYPDEDKCQDMCERNKKEYTGSYEIINDTIVECHCRNASFDYIMLGYEK